MADEKKPGALGAFLGRHGEKLALAVSGALLLAYLILGIGMKSRDPNEGKLTAAVSRITAEKGKPHPEDARLKAPATKDWVLEATDPWNKVKDAKGAGDWSASMTPVFAYREIALAVVKLKAVRVPSITLGSVDVALDSVTVNWTVQEFAKTDIAKETKTTDFLKLTHLVLERQVGGSGKWDILADKLLPKSDVYKDQKIDPKTKYAYRLTSHVEPDKLLREDAKGMTVGTAAPVQTLGIWKISFKNAMKGMVYITIEKFDKAAGQKLEKPHIHHVGDKIGWWVEPGQGADPVSRHSVSLTGGKQVTADFNTGMELKSVEPVKLTVDMKRCKTKFGPGGGKVGCDQIIEKRNFETNEIIFTDDEGEKKVYLPAPNVLDQLCEDHGGKKITVNLPGTDPAVTEAAKTKEDAAAEAAKKREVEAEKLFKDAEKADASNNKKKAIELYERLLKEFAATDFVSKHKKALIEGNLARLKL